MANLSELNMIVGRFETAIENLAKKQDDIITEQVRLNVLLSKRMWRDSVKVVGGAFAGGFTAVAVKLGIWGA